MDDIVVTADNFAITAARYYDDVAATDEDFKEDLRRFILVKRLFNQYLRTGALKERLVLNHLTVIFNVFGQAALPLLFHELRNYLPQLVVFLVWLDRLPATVSGRFTSSIPLDPQVVACLRNQRQI